MKNRTELNAEQKERYNRNRLIVYGRAGGACVKCGIRYSLDAHHKDSRTKKANVSSLFRGKLEKALDEMEKCVLLCKNCHEVLHTILGDVVTEEMTQWFIDNYDMETYTEY